MRRGNLIDRLIGCHGETNGWRERLVVNTGGKKKRKEEGWKRGELTSDTPCLGTQSSCRRACGLFINARPSRTKNSHKEVDQPLPGQGQMWTPLRLSGSCREDSRCLLRGTDGVGEATADRPAAISPRSRAAEASELRLSLDGRTDGRMDTETALHKQQCGIPLFKRDMWKDNMQTAAVNGVTRSCVTHGGKNRSASPPWGAEEALC